MNQTMSQAFGREGEDQWLNDIAPTMNALIHFLMRENNGVRVYEQKKGTDQKGREWHTMSNGLTYVVIANQWQVVSDLP